MHICFITHEYPERDKPNGGIGTFIATIAPELVANGNKVSVIGLSRNEKDSEDSDRGVKILRLHQSGWKKFRFVNNSYRLNSAIRKLHSVQPIDIIETPELGMAFIKKINGIKYVIRLHGGHHFFAEAEKRGINFWKGFQEKKSFRKADAFIGVSEFVVSHTHKYLSYYDKPIIVIYNPVDSNKYYGADLAKMIPGRILFVGTVCEKKGVRELLLAFKLVQERNKDSRLIITGRDWRYKNGDLFTDEMKALIAAENIIAVEFTGPLNYNKLPEEYEKAEICVFPSHMETQGIVALEAMSMGKPVVFSNVGPGKETIDDGINGVLVDPYNPGDIAEKINYLLDNKDLALNLGAKARARIIDKFNLKKILKENIDFYKKVRSVV